MKTRRKQVALAAVVASLATAGPLHEVAYADPVNDNNESQAGVGATPGPNPHTYCFGNTSDTNFRSWVDNSNYTTEQNSQLDTTRVSSCDRSGSLQTNVEWIVGGAGGSRGIADCVAPVPQNGACARVVVTIDLTVIASNDPYGGGYEQNVRKTICHENGHTMGLTHYKNDGYTIDDADPEHVGGTQHNDCLISGAVDGQDIWRVYNHHHKDHINANF